MSATAFQRMRREQQLNGSKEELSKREKKEAFNQEGIARSQAFKAKIEEAQALNAKLAQALIDRKVLENAESRDTDDLLAEINSSVTFPTETDGLKVEDLKVLAKEKGITGYSNMKRNDLLEALRG